MRYYSILFLSGLFICFEIVKKIFKEENFYTKYSEQLFIYGFIGILLGARLGHCLFYDFEYYSKHILEIFVPIKKIGNSYEFIGFAGLASHGGVIGLLLALFIFSKKYNVSIMKLLDIVAITAPLGGAFIRLGNFMNSEIIGNETSLPFGVVFHRIDNIPRHPTQLYEAVMYILIFSTLLIFYKNKGYKIGSGLFFGVCLSLVFVSRFFIEFVKINQSSFEEALILNMGQLLSIPIILIGILFIIRAVRYKNKLDVSN